METLQGLTQLNRVPLDMTLDGLAAVRQGQQRDNIGLQELMRKQAFDTQMDPLRVAEQGLRNKGLILDQQKSDYELKSLGRKDKMETELWDQTKATNLAKLLDQEGEAKANQFGQQIYQKLQTTRPGTPEHRALMGALSTTKEWVEKARDQRDKLAVVGAQGANALEVARVGANSRISAATIAAATKKALQQGMDPKKLVGELTQRILTEKDPELKAALQQELEFASAIAERFQVVPPQQIATEAAGGILKESRGPVPKAPGVQPKTNQTKSGIKFEIVD